MKLDVLDLSNITVPELTEGANTEMLKDRFNPFMVECEFQHK